MSPFAPTLVDAVRALSSDSERGFVFVRADGTERFYSFQGLAFEAESRAAGLAARGLHQGDRVALVIPDGEEFVLSFLGALFAGLVPVPIYPQSSFKNIDAYRDGVAHVVRASGASLLLTTPSARAILDSSMAGVAGVASLRATLMSDEVRGNWARAAGRRPARDDVAFLQFTSGSTSRPKGVVVTHGNLAANAEAFMIHGLRRDPGVDKGVSWLPLYHDMGLIGFVVGPLFANVPCVFLPTATFVRAPKLWLDKIHQHRGTITYAPNFAYALVAKRLRDKELDGLDLRCLRVAGCGAEPIQAAALRDFAARLAPAGFNPRCFVASYGMAEATLAVTFAPLGEGLRTDAVDRSSLASGRAVEASPGEGEPRPVTEIVDCGVPFPAHEVAVVDRVGYRLPERQVGEVVVRGPSVTKGYFEEPDLTSRAFRVLADDPAGAPWLHTGDLGYLAGGRLYVCGRTKDIVIVRGRNHYPTDIEWAVGAIPNVRRGNVVAFGVLVDDGGNVSGDGRGEEQLIVCCEGTASDARAIREAAAACVAARFGLTPHEVVVTPLASLPRTSSGKLQRSRARQLYLDGRIPRVALHAGVTSDGTSDEAERRAEGGA